MKNMTVKLQNYIYNIMGNMPIILPVPLNEMGKLPMFISGIYNLYQVTLGDIQFILVECKEADAFSISQLENHSELISNNLGKKVVLLAEDISALFRKRLIEKKINFIVPARQLYLPEFLMDLRERNQNWSRKKKTEKLLPSSQFILIYHILLRNDKENIEKLSFTLLASKFGYTKMAITKAVINLVYHALCNVEGTKEKYISFTKPKNKLWHLALPLFVNPVFRRIYVDEKPEGIHLLHANESALPEYSDMNPSWQKYYAIEKSKFYNLLKKGQLKNPNEQEGRYCLEVWKYNPGPLAEIMDSDISEVDPLSLYLSLKDNTDERIEAALETIIEKYIW